MLMGAGFLTLAPQAAWTQGRLAGLPTRFSTVERNLRWTRVRSMMRRDRFDCLITPAGDGDAAADSLYLTQQAGWVVFPPEGGAVLITDQRTPPQPDDWVKDVRVTRDGRWSPLLVDALREMKVDAARIGVGRLAGAPRNLDGDVSFSTLDALQRAFPKARFESATDQLVRVKLNRSAEEIALLEQVTSAGERGVAALKAAARPGTWHKDVWLAVFTALQEATGEPPARLAMRAGDEANTSTGGPMLERLESGRILNQEIAAQALNHMAQVNHSMVVGDAPPQWADAAKYCVDVFNELVEWIRPGRRFMDLCKLYAERAVARTPGLSPTWVLVHTCGLGDGPRMGAGRSEMTDLVIEPTMVFTLKPRIVIAGVKPSVQFGDPILVTVNGARRLGRRALGA